MSRLVEIENIDSHIIWKAERIDDSDWPVFLFVKMMYCDEFDREWKKNGKYHMSIQAVAPQAVSDKELQSCLSSMGLTKEQYDQADDIQKCRALADYGIHAPLWQEQGNNKKDLLKNAKEELAKISMLFGFYMDRQVNAIGNTGWDFIKGEIGFRSKEE